jgi:hypothetical protein
VSCRVDEDNPDLPNSTHQRLQQFSNATSISSADFFGETPQTQSSQSEHFLDNIDFEGYRDKALTFFSSVADKARNVHFFHI